jgi:hypothetical protein
MINRWRGLRRPQLPGTYGSLNRFGEAMAAEQARRAAWRDVAERYNEEMDGGSEDTADPDITTRVGTLVLAKDY